jgi:GAF domain-containing protein
MRILVLDDDAEYGQMIADFLRRSVPEYVTLAVATANETRAAARDADQPYDVLLIDQRLDAGQDGIELMQELRAQSPDTDAIIFTALNDPDSGLRAYHAGAYQYLPKPINTRELLWILRSLREARTAEQERRWLRTLTEIAEAAQRALSVTAVADILTQGGLRLGFERARLWQLDAERQLLVGISQAGDNGFPHFDGLRMPVAESPYCSRALQSAEPMVFRERELGPGYLEAVLAVGQFRLQRGEWVDIPLWVGDRCWGILALDNVERPQSLGTDHRNFLRLYGSQTAAALERARLFELEERKRKELAVLNEIGRKVTAFNDVEQLLHAVRQSVGQLMDVQNFAIILLDADPERLDVRLQVEHGEPVKRRWLARTSGLVGHLIQENTSILLASEAENNAYLAVHSIDLIDDPAKCWLGVPLRVAELAMGAIVVQSYQREYAFTGEDQRLLGAVADQVAGAIQTVNLAERERQKSQQLNLLHHASIELIQLAEEDATYFWRAALTTVTAEYGLSFNRAMLFLAEEGGARLCGQMGIGHFDPIEAQAAWDQDRADALTFDTFLERLRARQLPSTPIQSAVNDLRLPLARDKHVLAQVYRRPRRVIVPAAEARNRLPHEFIEKFGLADYAIVPLRAGRKVLGVVIVDNAHDHKPLHEETLDRLETLLAQTALIFENLRQRTAQEQFITVNNAIMSEVSERPLKLVLDQLCQAAQSLAEADCVLIYPLRSGVEPFEFDTLSTGCAGQRSNLHLTRGPSSMGVTAHILRTDTLVVPDVRQRRTRFHNQTLAQHSFLRQEGIKAFVGTPVRDVQSRELLGILYLDYRQPRKFSPRELHMVKLFAGLAAAAIQTAHTAQRARDGLVEAEARGRTSERELGLLQAVLRDALIITDFEEDKLARTLLTTARELLQPSEVHVSLLLRDWAFDSATGEPHEVRHQYFLQADNSLDEVFEANLYRGLTGLAFQSGKVQRVADVHVAPWIQHFYAVRHQDTCSELDVPVPIKINGQVIGVLNAESPVLDAFNDHDQQALERLAAVTALAFDNLQRQSHLRHVLDAAQAITRPVDLRTTLDAVKDAIQRAVPDVSCLTIWHEKPGSKQVVLGDYFGVQDAEVMKVEEVKEDSVVWKTMQATRPIWATFARQDPVLRGRFIEAESIVSTAAFPLRAGNDTVGAMFFNYREEHQFSGEEETLFPTLAAIVAASVRDASHLEQERKHRQRLDAALAITQAVGAELDLYETLRRIMAKLSALFKNTHPCVLIYQVDEQILEFQPASLEFYRSDNPAYTGLQRLAVDGPSLASRAARLSLKTGQVEVVKVDDVNQDPDYLPVILNTQSELCITLIGTDGLLGVLVIESPQPAGFDETDVELMRSVAQQISLALDRSRQSALLQFNSTVAATTAWAADIAHEANKKIGHIRNWAYLLREEASLSAAGRCYAQNIDDSAQQLDETLKGAVSQFNSTPQAILLDVSLEVWVNELLENQADLKSDFDLHCQDLRVWAHRAELQRVVRHLVRNAIYHTSGPGRIFVRSRSSGEQWVEIQFEDTGPGIPDRLWLSIFQSPTVRSDGSLGFGLLFVRFIVEKMGGTIRLLEPQPGRGAAFSLRLPIHHPSMKAET